MFSHIPVKTRPISSNGRTLNPALRFLPLHSLIRFIQSVSRAMAPMGLICHSFLHEERRGSVPLGQVYQVKTRGCTAFIALLRMPSRTNSSKGLNCPFPIPKVNMRWETCCFDYLSINALTLLHMHFS